MKTYRAASVSLLLGTSMLGLAGPAFAETLTVNDISIPIGEGIEIASVTVEDGNLSEEGLRALLSENPSASLASLATLDAKSVTVPEIRFSMPSAGGEGEPVEISVVYRDLVFSNVADGVAESAVLGSSSIEGAKDVAFEFGAMTISNFDVGALLGFYGFNTGTVSTEMAEVYSSFTFAGGSVTAPMVNCDIGGATGGAFSARPLSMSMTDMTKLTQELEAAQTAGTEPTPEQVSTLILFYADMLTAFTSDPMTFEGFDCTGTGEKGEKFAVSSSAFNVESFEPGIYPAFGLDAFEMSVEGEDSGTISLGNFTFKSIDFNDAIAAVRAAATLDETWFEANWRLLVPAFEGLSMTNLAVDIPNPESAGDRIEASMADLDITLGAYVNAILSDFALSIVDLIVPLPADGEPPIAELRARGINSLTIDAATSMIWNAADQTITVRDLALDAAELGSIRISGTLGNATEALFADTEAEALMAAQMLTIKDLTITLDDGGISGLIVAAASAEAGQPEGALRTQVSGLVQGMTLAILGNTDEALVAAQSLGKFLGGKARNVTVTLTSTDPAGLGIADLAAFEQDPTAPASAAPVEAAAAPVPADGGTQDEKLNLKN